MNQRSTSILFQQPGPPQFEVDPVVGQFSLLAPRRVMCVRTCGHSHR